MPEMVHPRPLIYTNAAAGAAFWGSVAIWVMAELKQGRRTRAEATAQDGDSRRVIHITIAAAWVIAVTGARDVTATTLARQSVAVLAGGLVLMWAGIALRLWAFHTLGQYFTFTVMTSSDQRVVSGGPYRLIRHPGYAGAALTMAGIGLAFGNWVSLTAMVVLPLVGYVNRIRVEERALDAALGDRYRAYAEHRKRLVPFVW